MIVNNLDYEQKFRLKRAAREGNLTEISKLMEEKLLKYPNFQSEYDSWTAQNTVPQSLREIVEGLSEAQLR